MVSLRPWIFPSALVDLIALPSPSTMRIKRKGERGSPYLRPLVGLKGLDGEPFNRIEKIEVVTRAITHLTQLWSNPYAIRTFLM